MTNSLWHDVYMIIKIIWVHCGYRIQVKVILAVMKEEVTNKAQKKFWGSNGIRILLEPQIFFRGFICNCLSYFITARSTFTWIAGSWYALNLLFVACVSKSMDLSVVAWRTIPLFVLISFGNAFRNAIHLQFHLLPTKKIHFCTSLAHLLCSIFLF